MNKFVLTRNLPDRNAGDIIYYYEGCWYWEKDKKECIYNPLENKGWFELNYPEHLNEIISLESLNRIFHLDFGLNEKRMKSIKAFIKLHHIAEYCNNFSKKESSYYITLHNLFDDFYLNVENGDEVSPILFKEEDAAEFYATNLKELFMDYFMIEDTETTEDNYL